MVYHQEIVAQTVMSPILILTTLLAANPPAAPPPERASLSLGAGARLSATLSGVDQQNEDQRPRITINLKKPGQVPKTLSLELTPERYPHLVDVIRGSFFWDLDAKTENLGAKQVARIGVFGRTGEDLMVIDEIAILLDTGDEPKVIWLGLGNREENRFDVCLIETKASFRLTKNGQLERRTRSVKHVGKIHSDDHGMAEYVRTCTTPKPRVETFPLGGGRALN